MKRMKFQAAFLFAAAVIAVCMSSCQCPSRKQACCADRHKLQNIPPAFGEDAVNIRKDILTRAYIAPKRVVWTSGEENVTNADQLLKIGTGQADLYEITPNCHLSNQNGQPASIILDFGRELHGGLKMVLTACNPAVKPEFRLRFGESVSETCSTTNEGALKDRGEAELEELTATNDHAMRDFSFRVPYLGQMEVGSTGFRFVRIDLLTPNVDVSLKEVNAVFRYRDIPYEGSFRCSDERLTKIWATGAYTVHLNMQEYIWDGVKRDRLIWMGDMHPETSTISTVFGNDESFYATMDLAVQQYPLPDWFNGMSAYSMWYLIIQHDWYMQNGNLDFLQKHKDYILGLIDQMDERVQEDGTEELGGGRFLDWPSNSNPEGVEAGYRGLLCWAMKDAAYLSTLLGDEARAAKANHVIEKLMKQVKDPNNLKQGAALMALGGMMDAEKACQDYLLVGGAKGFSTFYGYYMLEALAQAGHYQEAMDIISQFWGGMLDLGATTFWEDFNLDWTKNAAGIDEMVPEGKDDIHGDFGAYCYPGFRHSLCHGWASGPTAWMSHHILGVQVMEPGCKVVKVTPHLGNLQWAEGTYPTPMGNISIRHEAQADGTVKSTIHAPKGVKVVTE